MKKILLIISFILLANCSTTTKSHMSAVVGATAGYGTCHHMLNTGVAITAACTVVGSWLGASAFFNDDMNIHKAVFVDTLNTSPGKRSHTYPGVVRPLVIGDQLQLIELTLLKVLNVVSMNQ